MRTSNKLIILAFIITIVAMIIRDEQLKAAYLTKNYLDPLEEYTALDIKDFNAIEVTSAEMSNVKIVKGPFKVMVLRTAIDVVHFDLKDGKLHISTDFGKGDRSNVSYHGDCWVYISCPTLNELRLDSKYTLNDKMVTDTTTEGAWHKCMLRDFNIDSLYISMDNGCILQLDSNNIRSLKADMAMNTGSNSSLEIKKENKIARATINVLNNGDLNIYSPIPDLNYTMSDSASITLTGNVANKAKK